MTVTITQPRTTSPLFSLTVRPTPRSTLFPYTTLFRSLLGVDRDVRDPFGEPLPDRPLLREEPYLARFGAAQLQDRKSTRLNSSHGYISYAVFCLKKKKRSIAITSDRGGVANIWLMNR